MIYEFFSVDNVFFTVLGYPMSYLEFFGTVLNITCVWLVARRNIWNWPVGIAAVLFFGALFYQIRLYSDFIEQVYYLVTGFYGWYVWTRSGKPDDEADVPDTSVVSMSVGEKALTGAAIAAGTLGLGYFMARIHVIFPVWFPEAASFPYLDALTTVMSFAAQLLLVWKRFENWYLWIVVDVIGVWLYFEKDVKFVSLLYLVFLIIATNGLFSWRKAWKRNAVRAGVSGRKEVGVL